MAASHRSTRRSTDPSAADRTITIAASSGRIPGNDEADGAAAAAVAGTLTTQGRNDAVAGHGEGGGDGGDGQEQRVHALLEQIEDCGKNLRGQNRDRFQRGLEGLRREFSASAGRVRRLAADNGALSAENLSLSERVRALEEDTSQLNNQLDRQGEATMVALEETSENMSPEHAAVASLTELWRAQEEASKAQKEASNAQSEATRERKECANAVHALADTVRDIGNTVGQHTGQIGDLQGGQKDLQEGQELHASQIGDLQGAVKKLEIQGQTSAQVAAESIQHQTALSKNLTELENYVDMSQAQLKNYVDERLGLSPNENK